jgi:hypothetical protein
VEEINLALHGGRFEYGVGNIFVNDSEVFHIGLEEDWNKVTLFRAAVSEYNTAIEMHQLFTREGYPSKAFTKAGRSKELRERDSLLGR